MNIQEAKKQITQAVQIYLQKDAYGNFKIPVERQRPVFLVGAPGIGKTAIMEQIARDLGILLVSYSMTHHTRQSALGLPMIVDKVWQGETYKVSEYTMSEIIASVYEAMEASGKAEGILFLDEINCVSETLGPSMLQFLQYKTFGSHKVPDGWVIVTAGNPPEYNRAVREFDIATLDRLKVMEIAPEYAPWAEYARQSGIHPAIRTYLDIRRDDFYVVGNTAEGRSYVTARGWEDLSEAICAFEEHGYTVDETLVRQYLHNNRIASSFGSYYRLYSKYREDYQVTAILGGEATTELVQRAKNASIDERISLIGLLLEALLPELKKNLEEADGLKALRDDLRVMKAENPEGKALLNALEEMRASAKQALEQDKTAKDLTDSQKKALQYKALFAERLGSDLAAGEAQTFESVAAVYQEKVRAMKTDRAAACDMVDHLFAFLSEAYGEKGNEMLLLVTELTLHPDSARFLTETGSEAFFSRQDRMMLSERKGDLMKEVEKIRRDGDLT